MILYNPNQPSYEDLHRGVKKYAYFPTTMSNGCIIWLTNYYITIKRHDNGLPFSRMYGIQAVKVLNVEKYKLTGIDE